MIYFISDGSAVKIGYTSGKSESRLSTLQTGSSVKLTILATVPGERADEARLHGEFASKRIAGEWFRLTSGEVGGIVRRERHGVNVDRLFTQSGMEAIITQALDMRLRDAGIHPLLTITPDMTRRKIWSKSIVVRYCESARDIIVDEVVSRIRGFPADTMMNAISKSLDDGGIKLGILCSSHRYDLAFNEKNQMESSGGWFTYEEAEKFRSNKIIDESIAAKRLEEDFAF